MLLCFVRVSEIDTEAKAIDVVEELIDHAIEVKSVTRGRSKKIKALVGKLESVRTKCHRKGWKQPLYNLKEAFEIMKEAKIEEDNLFNAMFEI